MKTFLQATAALAVVVIIAGGGFLLGRYVFPKCPAIEPGRSDTVTVYDTIRIKQPVPVSQEVVRTVTARVKQANDTDVVTKIPPADSIPPVADSVDVEIPIERKVYQTEDYRAVVEGFHASLTSLDIYHPTRIVTQTVPIKIPDTRRWSFGLHAGYGATIHGGRVIMVPTVGVGVSYSLFKW